MAKTQGITVPYIGGHVTARGMVCLTLCLGDLL